MHKPSTLQDLRQAFGDTLQENARLSSYTTAHAGGTVDGLLVAHSADELEQAAARLWQMEIPFIVLGSGSNVLVSDDGLRGVVIVNRANAIQIDAAANPASVRAESGAIFGTVARQAALRGLGGLEWAATIPGTVGGAVYGNAGAHGSDTAASLILAEILQHHTGKQSLTTQQMEYAYRTSILKRSPGSAVILAARFKLSGGESGEIQARMAEFSNRRRSTQPPGASMGSMFKNPTGDYAGRLIEACGLKGKSIGGASISPIHANFFVNKEDAKAEDIGKLIRLAQKAVYEQFGISLELEIELLGQWAQD